MYIYIYICIYIYIYIYVYINIYDTYVYKYYNCFTALRPSPRPVSRCFPHRYCHSALYTVAVSVHHTSAGYSTGNLSPLVSRVIRQSYRLPSSPSSPSLMCIYTHIYAYVRIYTHIYTHIYAYIRIYTYSLI